MSSNPESRWFWNDWDNDKGLWLCSFAAQGLWMRMLSICARSAPIGYLAVDGRPVDAGDLAQLTGKPQAEVETLIVELSDRRVFSRDRRGFIYNRRMVRADHLHRMAVKNGKMGGNPVLRQHIDKTGQNSVGVKGADKPPDKGGVAPLSPLRPKGKEESLNLDSDSLAARGAALGANGTEVRNIVDASVNALSVREPLSKAQKHERWVNNIWLYLCRTRPEEEVARITESYANSEPWGKAQFEAIDAEMKALKRNGQ